PDTHSTQIIAIARTIPNFDRLLRSDRSRRKAFDRWKYRMRRSSRSAPGDVSDKIALEIHVVDARPAVGTGGAELVDDQPRLLLAITALFKNCPQPFCNAGLWSHVHSTVMDSAASS